MITRTSTPESADFTPKQEGNNISNSTSDATPSASVAKGPTTTSWSRLKDPRIVRVSRAFGGKDRHSKVCTVRGLRDRRVRLSVPTAIQLYDLQDRLGLNQPSKVVDWLLNAAKHEIDELPPLQIPPGSFVPSLQAMLASTHHNNPPPPPPPPPQSDKFEGLSLNWNDVPNYWNNNSDKSKEIVRETSDSMDEGDHDEEGGSSKQDDHDHRVGGGTGGGAFMLSNNLFQQRSTSTNHPPLPGLLNNVMPNTSFLKWDPSNLSLSQFGSYGLMATPQTDHHHQDVHNLISHQQLLPMYQSSQTQPYFPNSHGANPGEFDPKQFNFQMLSNSAGSSQNPLAAASSLYTMSQTMRPSFHLSMNPKLFPSGDHDSGGNERNKGS